jgi:hypothetical protein
MKLASCCGRTRNAIDVMKACTALAMAIMTIVVLMLLLLMMMMWGMLLTGLFLLLVATLVSSSTENATIGTYIHISDLSAIDVWVTDLNFCTTGIFSPVPITTAVSCCLSTTGFRLHRHFHPSITANYFLQKDHIN